VDEFTRRCLTPTALCTIGTPLSRVPRARSLSTQQCRLNPPRRSTGEFQWSRVGSFENRLHRTRPWG